MSAIQNAALVLGVVLVVRSSGSGIWFGSRVVGFLEGDEVVRKPGSRFSVLYPDSFRIAVTERLLVEGTDDARILSQKS